jgi:hypothetical protein
MAIAKATVNIGLSDSAYVPSIGVRRMCVSPRVVGTDSASGEIVGFRQLLWLHP